MYYQEKHLDFYIKQFLFCLQNNGSTVDLHEDSFSIQETKEILLIYACCGHEKIWQIESQLFKLLESQHNHIRLFAVEMLQTLVRYSSCTKSIKKRNMERIAGCLLQDKDIASLSDRQIQDLVKHFFQKFDSKEKFTFSLTKSDVYTKVQHNQLFPILQVLAKQDPQQRRKKQSPLTQIQKLYNRTEKALKNKYYDLAIELLKNQILCINPGDVKAQKLLFATLHRKYKDNEYPSRFRYIPEKIGLLTKLKFARVRKKWSEVVLIANDYLVYDPGNIRLLHTLGEAYLKEGHVNSAIFIFEFILTSAPDNAKALLALTQIYKDTQQYDKAIFYCRKASKLKPYDANIEREIKRIAAMKTTDIYDHATSSSDLIKDRDREPRLEKIREGVPKIKKPPASKPKTTPQTTPRPVENLKITNEKQKKAGRKTKTPRAIVVQKEKEVVETTVTKMPEETRQEAVVEKVVEKQIEPKTPKKIHREITTKKIPDIEIPKFEKFLSEDAGRPGPIERFIAQSVHIMKALQYTLGLKCIIVINAVDLTVDAFSSYVTGIFRTWKTSKSIYRNIQRKANNSYAAELTAELQKNRIRLSRLFMLSGYDAKVYTEPFNTTFAVKLIIELRGHLDEMKQDLAFITATQTTKTIRNSFKDTIMSFVPNPFSVFVTWKDLIILSLWMKYNRRQIEQLYADFVIAYLQIIRTLDKEYHSTLLQYEQDLLQRLQFNLSEQQEDLEYWIGRSRIAVQRIMQILVNPGKFIECARWSKADLISEIRNGNQNTQYTLQLEWWLNKEVAKYIKSKSPEEIRLCYEEARLLRRRYKLQKKL